MNFTRRNFIKATSVSTAGVAIAPELAAKLISSHKTNKVCVFSKCLQFLNYEELGKTIAKLGFDGADLTVRKGGHVLPENVIVDLPKAVKAIRKAGADVHMIVTDINDPDDKHTENILSTAADLGIKYYRMGYFKYNSNDTVFDSLDNNKRQLEGLLKLNRKYNVKSGYQNHSGPWGMVGAAVWDLHYLLRDFDPKYIGVQYDIMHAVAEGGFSWEVALKVIAPWINSLAIKDFVWKKGGKRWETKWVPLGEGMVNFKKYLNEIDAKLSSVPITLHYEYDLGGAELGNKNPSMLPEDIYKHLTRDLHYFKNTLLGS
ncbi:sugar phosphate isomerase/epimerase [Maribellus luteus]|uniref:Sugar phosphate isomerase/epimerase n=1 Tax=Maribellus luteus TaxID=2305463 RepID=A0A399T4Z2_9BACT|nr:sugar phosphate isomerase/epimerase [Maribellus luteus]RIJ49994.1 sugar phosphate isomerase/epimerase [Maribellus luteus]